jgi:hypothetical protein
MNTFIRYEIRTQQFDEEGALILGVGVTPDGRKFRVIVHNTKELLKEAPEFIEKFIRREVENMPPEDIREAEFVEVDCGTFVITIP